MNVNVEPEKKEEEEEAKIPENVKNDILKAMPNLFYTGNSELPFAVVSDEKANKAKGKRLSEGNVKKESSIKGIIIKKKKKKVKDDKYQSLIDSLLKIKTKNISNIHSKISEAVKEGADENFYSFFTNLTLAKELKNRIIKLPSTMISKGLSMCVYLKNFIKRPIITTDKLFWASRFYDGLLIFNEVCKQKKQFAKYLEKWGGDTKMPFSDIYEVRLIGEPFSLLDNATGGYFEDYDPLFYGADYFYLKNCKYDTEADNILKSDGKKFIYNGLEYDLYSIEQAFDEIEDGWGLPNKWNPCVIIDDKQINQINSKCNSVKFIHFEKNKDTKTSGLISDLKKLYGKKKIYYLDSSFVPVYFCPSVIALNKQVMHASCVFRVGIDLDYFISTCVTNKSFVLPPYSVTFDNIEDVYRLGFIYLVSLEKLEKDDEELKKILEDYSQYRVYFKDAAKVFNMYKRGVLDYIEAISSNRFVFDKFVNIGERFRNFVIEYDKIVNYFSPSSIVYKIVEYFKESGISMYNFFLSNVIQTAKTVMAVCYQIKNLVADELDISFRAAGFLCYNNLIDGPYCVIYDTRSKAGFLGGLESENNTDEIIERIKNMLSEKIYIQLDRKKKLEIGASNFTRANYAFLEQLKKYIKQKATELNKDVDIEALAEYIADSNGLLTHNLVVLNRLLEDRNIARMHDSFRLLDEPFLDENLAKYIDKILGTIDGKADLTDENVLEDLDRKVDNDLREVLSVYTKYTQDVSSFNKYIDDLKTRILNDSKNIEDNYRKKRQRRSKIKITRSLRIPDDKKEKLKREEEEKRKKEEEERKKKEEENKKKDDNE